MTCRPHVCEVYCVSSMCVKASHTNSPMFTLVVMGICNHKTVTLSCLWLSLSLWESFFKSLRSLWTRVSWEQQTTVQLAWINKTSTIIMIMMIINTVTTHEIHEILNTPKMSWIAVWHQSTNINALFYYGYICNWEPKS